MIVCHSTKHKDSKMLTPPPPIGEKSTFALLLGVKRIVSSFIVCRIVKWAIKLCTLTFDRLASCQCLFYRVIKQVALSKFEQCK